MHIEKLRTYKQQIIALTSKYGVDNIRVFGSVARGDENEYSDIDLLVTAPDNIGFRFYGIAKDLEDLLGNPVDIVSDKYINPLIAKYILDEAVPL